MTKTLYLEDSYLKECEAKVVEIIDGKGIVLDQTIFYPRGGGQPSDTGKMIASGREYMVLNVVKKEGKIIHELENAQGIEIGTPVHLVLDWDRRYKLMRMHTAAHLLAATMNKELGVLITGNELGEDKTRFDFNMDNFDREKFDQIIKIANELLNKDLDLKIYTLPREEAMKIPGIVKLAGALPPSITNLRIVEIPGSIATPMRRGAPLSGSPDNRVDIQADGGTHVKNLKEVGQIELQKLENKGKNNKRIYFSLRP